MKYIKIINSATFKTHDVDTSDLGYNGDFFTGDIIIDGKIITGDHGKNDYKEFGFELDQEVVK